MSMKTALLIAALMAIFAVSGCTTTQYVPVRPDCTPPPAPVLPAIDRGALWDAVGDHQYRVIERYIDGLWAAHDEAMAMLEVLCRGEE